MALFLLVTVSLFVALTAAAPIESGARNQINSYALIVILAVLAVVDVATAEVAVNDRLVYVQDSELAAGLSLVGAISALDREPLFVFVAWVGGRLGHGEWGLFGLIAFISAVGHLLALRLILQPSQVLVAWLTLLATGLFRAYAAVASRQGLAITLVVIAVCWFASRDQDAKPFYALLLGACLFHWSAIVPALGLVALRTFRPTPRSVAVMWSTAALLFLSGLNQTIFGRFSDRFPAIEAYAGSDALQNYGGGVNRLDFFLAMLVITGVVAVGLRLQAGNPVYQRLSTAYLVMSSQFLLFGYVAFSDRLAAYAWFLVPALLWYPILQSRTRVLTYASVGGVIAVVTFGLVVGGLGHLANF